QRRQRTARQRDCWAGAPWKGSPLPLRWAGAPWKGSPLPLRWAGAPWKGSPLPLLHSDQPFELERRGTVEGLDRPAGQTRYAGQRRHHVGRERGGQQWQQLVPDAVAQELGITVARVLDPRDGVRREHLAQRLAPDLHQRADDAP